jgi:hypothetical protein
VSRSIDATMSPLVSRHLDTPRPVGVSVRLDTAELGGPQYPSGKLDAGQADTPSRQLDTGEFGGGAGGLDTREPGSTSTRLGPGYPEVESRRPDTPRRPANASSKLDTPELAVAREQGPSSVDRARRLSCAVVVSAGSCHRRVWTPATGTAARSGSIDPELSGNA